MRRVRISADDTAELGKLWQEWHHSLGSSEITSLNEAGRDEGDGTMDFDIDDRLEGYLKERGFPFQKIELTVFR